jgi:hypothetical protein
MPSKKAKASSSSSSEAASSTAAKIAALAAFHPAHPTSLGMQVLAEDKLKWRMRLPGTSSSASVSEGSKGKTKSKRKKPASKEGEIVSALGFILTEWVKILESRRSGSSSSSSAAAASSSASNSPSPTYLSRLGAIASELSSNPLSEPISAVGVHDAGTAIPSTDLDSIIARIPNPVKPDSAEFTPGEEEDNTLTPQQRQEEQSAMDTIRQKYEQDATNGVVHQNFLTADLLAAARLP